MHQKMQQLVKPAEKRAPCPRCGDQPHEWQERGWTFLECSPCHARTPRALQAGTARAMWDAMAEAGVS